MSDSKTILAQMYKNAEYYLDKATAYVDVDASVSAMYNAKYEETMKDIADREREDRKLKRFFSGNGISPIQCRTSYEYTNYPRG